MNKKKDVIERLFSTTPRFFRKLGNGFLAVAVIGGAIVSAVATGGLTIPVWVGATLTAVGTTGKVICELTTESED